MERWKSKFFVKLPYYPEAKSKKRTNAASECRIRKTSNPFFLIGKKINISKRKIPNP